MNPKSPASSAALPPKVRQDRNGKKLISAHFDTESYELFKAMSANQKKSTDILLHEAVAELFKKHNLPVPKAVALKLKIRGVFI